ncbi:hypothetical protein [Planctomicrobium sp. SH664]|uniref:hypothetical protein n=1 Tax=Planctomicrobium sp. SH664 TaxID=3448125 RepID=UPI003F5B751F
MLTEAAPRQRQNDPTNPFAGSILSQVRAGEVVLTQSMIKSGVKSLVMNARHVVTLYCSVGQPELDFIAGAGWVRLPLSQKGMATFTPVLSEAYAIRIAREQTRRANSEYAGYVLRFHVEKEYLERLEFREAGGRGFREFVIPEREHERFNAHLVGEIALLHEFVQQYDPDQA